MGSKTWFTASGFNRLGMQTTRSGNSSTLQRRTNCYSAGKQVACLPRTPWRGSVSWTISSDSSGRTAKVFTLADVIEMDLLSTTYVSTAKSWLQLNVAPLSETHLGLSIHSILTSVL